MAGTRAALKSAGAFSTRLQIRIRLIGLEVVPYPLSLTEPPRGRDMKQTLRQLFEVPALVVMGGPRRLWRSREQRLARWLGKRGHSVLFVAA